MGSIGLAGDLAEAGVSEVVDIGGGVSVDIVFCHICDRAELAGEEPGYSGWLFVGQWLVDAGAVEEAVLEIVDSSKMRTMSSSSRFQSAS